MAQMLEIWYVAILVVLYHICSNESLRVQNDPRPRDPGFDAWNIQKVSSSEHLASDAWICVCSSALLSFTTLVNKRAMRP